MSKAIAVVEDDESIREMLRYYFQSVGYAVRAYESGEALFAGEEGLGLPALYILDIMLPGMDGLEILRRLREGRDTADVPVIMLTARSAEMDRVAGLENGADDYVVKPFNPLELTARVKSQLRRYTQLNPNSASKEKANNEITIKGMTINKDNHKVIVDDEEIKLTPIEFDILYLLASNPGKVFSTDEIFEKVWNEKVYEANNTVMVHIRRLRGKMKEDTRQNKIITTVWGVGYKIEK